MNKSVVLKLDGDLEVRGFRAILEIRSEGESRTIEKWGNLPPDTELVQRISEWRQKYRKMLKPFGRLYPKDVTYQEGGQDPIGECQKAANALRDRMAKWLDSDEFRPIDRCLREQLNPDDDIHLVS